MIVFANGRIIGTDVNSGETSSISSSEQGNITKVYINTDSIEEKLDVVILELKKVSFQLALMTDTYLKNDDIIDEGDL